MNIDKVLFKSTLQDLAPAQGIKAFFLVAADLGGAINKLKACRRDYYTIMSKMHDEKVKDLVKKARDSIGFALKKTDQYFLAPQQREKPYDQKNGQDILAEAVTSLDEASTYAMQAASRADEAGSQYAEELERLMGESTNAANEIRCLAYQNCG